jgi:hypothetical protein
MGMWPPLVPLQSILKELHACGSIILNGHVDRYSRIHDMNSSDTPAILAQASYDFNGGEICTSIGTLHNILVRQHVQSILNGHVDRSIILNGHVDRYSMTDDMNSSDAHAILAQTPYDFYAGEN